MTPTCPMRALECRLYPTPAQAEYLTRVFGHTRYVYNHILSSVQTEYEVHKLGKGDTPKFGQYALSYRVRPLKINQPWLYDVPDNALREATSDLTEARSSWRDSVVYPSVSVKCTDTLNDSGEPDRCLQRHRR